MLGGALVADVNVLGDVGRAMGTAYQLADDVLGVFGDPERTGKSAQSICARAKLTMLISSPNTGRTDPNWWRFWTGPR